MPDAAIAPQATILIIDDSPENLRVLSKTLEIHGYAVRCATSGTMAFSSIQNSAPDLILLDIRMPDIDGFTVCQQLKQNSAACDIPIIFLSALGDVRDIVKAFQVGGVDYITKPFQTEEVLARIRNQLTIQTLKQQLYAQNQSLLQEIDERQKFEQALRQEIQRRTIVEASLQDAKNAAEAASDAKSEFLAQMSHELRTPLNAILGFTALLLQERSLTRSQQSYAAKIDDNARQLLRLINGILRMTQEESSHLALNEQEFDLHQLLDAIVAFWQPKLLEKGLQLAFYRAAAVPQFLYADESKLRQILMHLLDSALQHTQGCIALKIEAESQPSPGNETQNLIIEVQSSKTAICLGEADTLFQLFSQPQANPAAQKLGLNLLLLRQFAQLMNGNVFCKSSADTGILVQVNIWGRTAPYRSEALNCQFDPVNAAPDSGNLTLENLQTAMSEDWLLQLHQAAVKGFDQQILRLLQEMPDSHADCAKTLETWTRNFQFDRIVEITQAIA